MSMSILCAGVDSFDTGLLPCEQSIDMVIMFLLGMDISIGEGGGLKVVL